MNNRFLGLSSSTLFNDVIRYLNNDCLTVNKICYRRMKWKFANVMLISKVLGEKIITA